MLACVYGVYLMIWVDWYRSIYIGIYMEVLSLLLSNIYLCIHRIDIVKLGNERCRAVRGLQLCF
jgi:hypothetical protein